jgi:hypothetical protein
MFKRDVTVTTVKQKTAEEGHWKTAITAKDEDTTLKFTAGGQGEEPVWVREGKVLNVTIEVEREEV